jgi:hypothetical protein
MQYEVMHFQVLSKEKRAEKKKDFFYIHVIHLIIV